MFFTTIAIICSFFGFLDSSITKIKSQEKKVEILYFGAEWCAPCKKMKELFKDEKVKNLLDKYDFKMYDFDVDVDISKKYNIKYLPTTIIKSGDNILYRKSGYINKETFLEILKQYERIDSKENSGSSQYYKTGGKGLPYPSFKRRILSCRKMLDKQIYL